MPRQAQTERNNTRDAFTLLEVLVVVVILGIVALAVVPRISSATGINAQAAARLVVSDLMYAQNEAIAQQAARQVIFDASAETYRLTDSTGTNLPAVWLGGEYIVNFTTDSRFDNVTIESVDFGGQPQVSFDDLGTPNSGGTVEVKSGTSRYRITVAAFTGRITVDEITGG